MMPQLQAAPPELTQEIRSCMKCSLHEGRDHPVVGSGDGRSGLLVLGEAPGAEEDRTGVPFVGRSGRLLRLILIQELGLDDDQMTISNVVRCRPPKNRTPTRIELATCWPFMERQIAFLRPRAILTVGNTPSRALLQTKEGITTLRGRTYDRDGVIVVPTFHPAAALRGRPEVDTALRSDVRLLRDVLGAGS